MENCIIPSYVNGWLYQIELIFVKMSTLHTICCSDETVSFTEALLNKIVRRVGIQKNIYEPAVRVHIGVKFLWVEEPRWF